jgi:hypothetical protein
MMLGEEKSGMRCAEFDVLLTDAIDGALSGETEVRFEQHGRSCANCAALWAEVRSGVEWLKELEEVASPAMLMHNILAATSEAVESVPVMPRPSPWQRMIARAHGFFAPVLTPRFGMSMGMAFFSITLLLNMAQIRIKDLTPHNLSHTFYTSQNRMMKYYENIRLVYEIESRVRDLRNSEQDNERQTSPQPDKSRQQNEKSDPQGPRRREYSRDAGTFQFASLSMDERTYNFTGLAPLRRDL